MELKDVIGQIGIMRGNCCYEGSREHEAFTAAAEALALVAWAEEKDLDIISRKGGWYANDGNLGGVSYEGDSILGCIRAAKEAYDDAK